MFVYKVTCAMLLNQKIPKGMVSSVDKEGLRYLLQDHYILQLLELDNH